MGHDTVIAPVLAGLGVYTGGLCAWPPYASRIVFELLVAIVKNREVSDARHLQRRGPDQADQGLQGSRPCPLEAIESAVVSLYNPHKSLSEAWQE